MRIGIGLKNYFKNTTGGTPSPSPTPADFVVTNDTEYATAHSAATSGQIIEMVGTGFGHLAFNKANVTLRGLGTARAKSLNIHTSPGSTVRDIILRPNGLGASGGVPGYDNPPRVIALGGNCDGFTLTGMDVACGYGPEGYAAFDPTADHTRYPEFGPPGGSAAQNALCVDDYPDGLYLGHASAGIPSGSITIENNSFTDLFGGARGSWAAGGMLKINNNRFGRIYGDALNFGPTGTAAITGIEICGNEFFDFFAQPQDNENPHGDMVQITGVSRTAGYPINNVLIAGNIGWYTPGARGQAQRLFISDTDVSFLGMRAVDNLLISRITDKGIHFSDDDIQGHTSPFAYRNTCLTNPANNTPFGNELTTNAVSGISASSANTTTIRYKESPSLPDQVGFFSGNIVEGGGTFIDPITTGALANIGTGLGSTATSYQTWLDTDTAPEWAAVNSAEATVAAFTPKATYAAFGAARPGDTWASLKARWGVAGNRPWTSIPSHIGFAEKLNQAASTVVESEWTFCHVHEAAGRSFYGTGEYKLANDSSGTGDTGWLTMPTAGSPGTLTHGKWIKRRVTTAAGSSQTASVSMSVVRGDATVETFSFSTTTADTSTFPVVAFNTSRPDSYRRTGSLGTNSRYLLIAVPDLKKASLPTATEAIFTATIAGAKVIVSLLSTGRMRIVLVASDGTSSRAENTTNLCDGTARDVLVSIDLNAASNAAGVQFYVDGVNVNSTTATWNGGSGKVIDFAASYTYAIGGTQAAAGTQNFTGELGALYIAPGQWLDLSVSANRDKFTAGQIGLTGTGPTGVQPAIFQTGNAAEWASGDASNGSLTGAFLPNTGAGVTNVGAGTAWD